MSQTLKQSPRPIEYRRQLLYLFLPVATLIVAGMMLIRGLELERVYDRSADEAEIAISVASASLARSVQWRAKDLRYLADKIEFRKLLDAPGRTEMDLLAGDWKAFSENRGIYDQIRWIDETGMERLRIDYRKPVAVRIADSALQDKATRYFFVDTFRLGKGEIFISPLDLNIEGNEIEVPHKPTLRIGTPVFDSKGRKRGIVILNYLASDLLTPVGHRSGVGNTGWLLNREGYWLKGPSPAEEFGFMFGRQDLSFASRYPEVWHGLQQAEEGQFRTGEDVWTFRTVYPLREGQMSSSGSMSASVPSAGALAARDYYWKVVYLSPASGHAESMFAIDAVLTGGAGILLMLFFVGSWRLARARATEKAGRESLERMVEERTYDLTLATKSLEDSNIRLEREVAERTVELTHANEELRQIARRDALTGLANRMAAEERLHDEFVRFRRTAQAYSLLTADIDHFKQVNDQYGHEVGDEVLRHVARILRSSVRESDFVARVGGEEFVILLPSTGLRAAMQVAEKIRQAVESASAPNAGRVTISLGVATANAEHNDSSAVSRESDCWLYIAKKAGRNRVGAAEAEHDASISPDSPP